MIEGAQQRSECLPVCALPQLNDVEDVEAHLPGLIDGAWLSALVLCPGSDSPVCLYDIVRALSAALREWLRLYKSTSASGTINEFGFDGKCLSREFAENVVEETHAMWKGLIKNKGAAAVV